MAPGGDGGTSSALAARSPPDKMNTALISIWAVPHSFTRRRCSTYRRSVGNIVRGSNFISIRVGHHVLVLWYLMCLDNARRVCLRSNLLLVRVHVTVKLLHRPLVTNP